MGSDIGPRLNYRRKPCDGCAFRSDSPERKNKEWWDDIMLSCCHRVFICHKTCLQLSGDQWSGSFDPLHKNDGSECRVSDHLVCAGFAKRFGEDFGIDPSTIEEIP